MQSVVFWKESRNFDESIFLYFIAGSYHYLLGPPIRLIHNLRSCPHVGILSCHKSVQCKCGRRYCHSPCSALGRHVATSFSPERRRTLRCNTWRAVSYATSDRLATQHELIPQLHLSVWRESGRRARVCGAGSLTVLLARAHRPPEIQGLCVQTCSR
jgi:hypothetical protein